MTSLTDGEGFSQEKSLRPNLMRIAYFECFSGISGDMMLGALLHAGVSEELLRRTVTALGVGAELRVSHVDRSASPRPRSTLW